MKQISLTCLTSVYDTCPGWVAGSYSDIKTNLSQVGLDWDWPTGLSLAKLRQPLTLSGDKGLHGRGGGECTPHADIANYAFFGLENAFFIAKLSPVGQSQSDPTLLRLVLISL